MENPRWRISISHGVPGVPKVEPNNLGKAINLGPWHFIIKEREHDEEIASGYHVLFVPNYPYFAEEVVFQRTVYLLREDDGNNSWPPITFIDVKPEIGAQYLNSIGQYLESHTSSFGINQLWIMLAFNISGYNRHLFTNGTLSPETIKDEILRNKLAQSVPVLHAQLLISSDPNFIERLPSFEPDSLTPGSEIFNALAQKLIKEMGFDQDQITPKLITQCLTLMRKDERAVARWKQIINPAETKTTFNQITECAWFDDDYGLGLRIRLPYSLIDGLCHNGDTIWSILSAIEEKLASSGLFSLDPNNDFPLPSYNFTVTLHGEDGQMIIDLCPHDSIRAGSMEQMGIFVCRPNRNNT